MHIFGDKYGCCTTRDPTIIIIIAVTQSSGGDAISYVLPVLRMTSYFHTMARYMRREKEYMPVFSLTHHRATPIGASFDI